MGLYLGLVSFVCGERQIVMVRDVEASLLSAEEADGGKGLG